MMDETDNQKIEAEVVVIGGGPGGYAAAFRAADLGKQVVLIDSRDHLGGVCLLEGCVPSKAMISAAELFHSIHDAETMGITCEGLHLDMKKLGGWRDDILLQMSKGIEGLAKRRNVRWIRGKACFADTHRLILQESAVSSVKFQNVILATGSRPFVPTPFVADGRQVLTSSDILQLKKIPETLLVIGGGYIGLEMGGCFRMMGSEVTIVELTDQLLPGTDRDLVEVVARKLKADGVTVLLETKVTALKSSEDGVTSTLMSKDQQSRVVDFKKVLMAVGRLPNTENLGLDRIGLQLDGMGRIPVDQQCRTQLDHVFAVGDCTTGPMLAHKARRQGLVAAEVLCGHEAIFDPRAIPAVIFSSPEIAYSGLSEYQAQELGRDVKTGRFWFRGNPRAQTLLQNEGFAKIISDRETEEILGIRMVGPCASELLAEATLAIEMGATLEDMIATIHAHPTLAETMLEAAEVTRGQAVHFFDPRNRG